LRRKIFITGATGFVGSTLARLLDFPENEIYGTSFPDKPNPLGLKCRNNIRYLDIRQEGDITEFIKEIRPDRVFHLAAVSNVGHSWKKRKETIETNLLGTQNVFEALRKYSPQARVLFTSSSDVYGDVLCDDRGLCEDDSIKAVSPYAFSKISGELLSRFYADVEGLQIVIARSFPHTGPEQSPDFVCSDWAYQIAKIEEGSKRPVMKVGNIDVKRDFSDVRDVVKAYVQLLKMGRKGEIYNVASGKAVSLQKILDILLSFSSLSIKVQVDLQRLRKKDIPSLRGDNSKIRKETGWKPEVSLRQTLEDLLEYWRNKISYSKKPAHNT